MCINNEVQDIYNALVHCAGVQRPFSTNGVINVRCTQIRANDPGLQGSAVLAGLSPVAPTLKGRMCYLRYTHIHRG